MAGDKEAGRDATRPASASSHTLGKETPKRLDHEVEPAPPRLRDRVTFWCGRCDHEADATFSDKLGRPEWLVGNAHVTRCPKGRECLAALAEWLGTTPAVLKNEPRPWLAKVGGKNARRSEPKPLPSRAQIDGWSSRLLSSSGPLGYLTEVRGLSLDVIERARIGWDGDSGRLTFPMYAEGELVAFKTRKPRPKAKMISWPGEGRPWPLYPDPGEVASDGWLLLVAGELDALRGRTAGLPATSVTLGAGTWREVWTVELASLGVPVVVCFDNNERRQARAVVTRLRTAGVEAATLSLRRLGLHTRKGDLSDYLNGGGSALELKRLIRRERRAAR